MDAVVGRQPEVVSNSRPPNETLAETKRPSCRDIGDLIALVRANEDSIFSHARKREIDPLTLRTQLLLHLPQFVTTNYFPNERDIQRQIVAASDFLEGSARSVCRQLVPARA